MGFGPVGGDVGHQQELGQIAHQPPVGGRYLHGHVPAIARGGFPPLIQLNECEGRALHRFLAGGQAPHQDLPGLRLENGAAADHPLPEKLCQHLADHGFQVGRKLGFGQEVKGGLGDGDPQDAVEFGLVVQQDLIGHRGLGVGRGRGPGPTSPGRRRGFLGDAPHVVHGFLEPLLHLFPQLLLQIKHRGHLRHQLLLLLARGLHVLHQEFADGLDVLPGHIPHQVLALRLRDPGRQNEGQQQAQGQEQRHSGARVLPGGQDDFPG